MAQPNVISLRRIGGILAVDGELDADSAPLLDNLLHELEAPLQLDLSQLTFIDSAGLHVLVRHHHDNGLSVLHASSCVRRLFQLIGVNYLLGPDDDTTGA